MVVVFLDSFKTLITYRCLFFLTFFFTVPISASGIAVCSIIEGVTNDGVRIKLFFTGFYLLNQIFLRAGYFFSFLMHWCNICLIDCLDDFLAD